ncbi:MAG: DUF5719 family protein [Actinomycetota bacterium]|nr:DUF5719 family protein [Actinomycetota bacterium]
MTRRDGALRLGAIGTVVVALALAGVANALVRPARPGARAPIRVRPAAVALGTDVSSAAWYCPGPLPVGAGAPAAAIEVVNLGGRPVRGEVIVHGEHGLIRTKALAIDVRASVTVPLPDTGKPTEAAATVLVDRSGVGVQEVVAARASTISRLRRPAMASPCLQKAGSTAYLAAGDSRGGDNLDLALYDPGATPAIANVALATAHGAVAPPAFQGVPVGAGSLVVLDVGRALPGASVIGTTVSATGGALATGAELTMVHGEGIQTALTLAAARPARQWSLPATLAGSGTSESLALYDPGKQAASVTLELYGAGGPAEASATVPAGGVITLQPAAAAAAAAVRAEAVVVDRGGPVVVSRQVAAAARPAQPSTRYRTVIVKVKRRVHGHLESSGVPHRVLVPNGPAQPTLLPALPAGDVAPAAIEGTARHWLLPVADPAPSAGELVEVANPGDRPAGVELATIAPSGGGRAVLAGLGQLIVPAHGTLSVALAGLLHPAGPAPLEVTATAPVTAAALDYSDAKQAPGLNMATGIPVIYDR